MKIKTGQFGSGVPDANRRLNEGIGDRLFTQHIDSGQDLPEVPVKLEYIETVPSAGYRLVPHNKIAA
jgi:hypothetical protein